LTAYLGKISEKATLHLDKLVGLETEGGAG